MLNLKIRSVPWISVFISESLCVVWNVDAFSLDNLCCYGSYSYSFTVSKESYHSFPTSRIRSKIMFVMFILWYANESFWEKQQLLLNLWKAAVFLLVQMSCLLCSTTFLLALENKYGTKWRTLEVCGWLFSPDSFLDLIAGDEGSGGRGRMTPAGPPRWGEKSFVLRDPKPREWRLH